MLPWHTSAMKYVHGKYVHPVGDPSVSLAIDFMVMAQEARTMWIREKKPVSVLPQYRKSTNTTTPHTCCLTDRTKLSNFVLGMVQVSILSPKTSTDREIKFCKEA